MTLVSESQLGSGNTAWEESAKAHIRGSASRSDKQWLLCRQFLVFHWHQLLLLLVQIESCLSHCCRYINNYFFYQRR